MNLTVHDVAEMVLEVITRTGMSSVSRSDFIKHLEVLFKERDKARPLEYGLTRYIVLVPSRFGIRCEEDYVDAGGWQINGDGSLFFYKIGLDNTQIAVRIYNRNHWRQLDVDRTHDASAS